MDPYQILGVDIHATDEQIRNAYRKLVKQYHPDKNKSSEAATHIVLINAAYDILSDPEKRARYHNPVYTGVAEEYVEDPVEAYKREFKQKRWEEEKRKKDRRARYEKKTYKVIRLISFPILVFALVLVTDNLLPRKMYAEVAELGWQQRTSGNRRSPGMLMSYLQTAHFVMRVPHELHLNYPYYDSNKPKLKIFATPIFIIPRNIAYTIEGMYRYVEIKNTIHAYGFLSWLLLLSSAAIAIVKEYSKVMFSLCFLPIIFLAIILLIMI